MNGPTQLTKEMSVRARKNGQYRYRRFQALDDTLILFFNFQAHPYWLSTTDLIGLMEWQPTHATRKRTRRLCEALLRCGKLETQRVHGGSINGMERFWRILE